jgi:8-oxo-dGTP pyrophosphatase MutT (NUDIX family)
MKRNVRAKLQFAALPCRLGESGQIQVLLLTSRETHRWVIPKGWPIRGLKPAEVAAREAYEEAGLAGRIIGKRRIGMFTYQKRTPQGAVLCEVRVFLLWVSRQSKKWPEKAQRETRWFESADAAALVAEDGLADIIKAVITKKRLRRFCPSPLPATTPEHAPPEPAAAPAEEAWPASPDTEIQPADLAPPVPALLPPQGRRHSAQ